MIVSVVCAVIWIWAKVGGGGGSFHLAIPYELRCEMNGVVCNDRTFADGDGRV